MITDHHDGHELNDSLVIEYDDRDPNAGGASHDYLVLVQAQHPGVLRREVAEVHFQHGPRDEPESTPGVTDAVLLAIVLDRYRAA